MTSAAARSARLPGSVQAAPAETMDLRTADLVFADPSRRRGAARLFDPRSFSPPWPVVLDLLRRPAGSGRPNSLRAVVKLAPGLDHALVPDHVEADWVSLNGQLKEVALWAPAPGSVRRRATLIRSETGTVSCTDAGAPAEPPAVGSVGRYLYEPDPAVIRAHLVSAAVAEVDGWLLDPHIAYVCSDREVRSALSRRYRVLDVLPVKEKALRAALAARGIGPITIKKRGVQISPEELRRRLALQGSRSATLVLTRTPGSATALLVEPGE